TVVQKRKPADLREVIARAEAQWRLRPVSTPLHVPAFECSARSHCHLIVLRRHARLEEWPDRRTLLEPARSGSGDCEPLIDDLILVQRESPCKIDQALDQLPWRYQSQLP